MVFREAFETQDIRRMCKHAERDHEKRKLNVLLDRLNRQLAKRGGGEGVVGVLKPPTSVVANDKIARQAGRLSLLDS